MCNMSAGETPAHSASCTSAVTLWVLANGLSLGCLEQNHQATNRTADDLLVLIRERTNVFKSSLMSTLSNKTTEQKFLYILLNNGNKMTD